VQHGGAEPVPYVDGGNIKGDIRARQNHVIFARGAKDQAVVYNDFRYSTRSSISRSVKFLLNV
jgi:hypothetical protein